MKLHHVSDGPADGPPLVLLCSLGSTVDMWAPQRRDLAGEYRVITLDTRGHGGSPVADGPYEVADLALDALETLDDLGVERASFAGVSLGGAVAQWIGLHAPERAASLAMLCTAARFPNADAFRDRATTARTEGVASIADAVVARWFTDEFAETEPDTVRRMRDMIASTPAEGYAGCCEAVAAWDVVDQLGGITVPTLVVGGVEDPATPPECQQILADGIPGARLETVTNAAHLASYQRPDVVTPLLREHAKGAS
ncbi:3-oxoadipate enol-lactonase [Actinomycetospora sp. NBRC 106375]|uniref:3-oxoadipate enol-lactonase n=1 Tax=Actinomycetospora sp. NBRC 106375 TaxID=3032207 RepID=UPI0024A171E3|nr:3-oxoadipate enol-lactonase [Actinomycetospora sp. NBRC 106375]GLZ46234.1 3-oxoadipate enol-lactonase [Actinomycetospora sp. NBRC 106375]